MKSVIGIQGEELVREYQQASDKIQFILKNQSYCESGFSQRKLGFSHQKPSLGDRRTDFGNVVG